MKTLAVPNAAQEFNLKSLTKGEVADLLDDMKYIYPFRPDVCDNDQLMDISY